MSVKRPLPNANAPTQPEPVFCHGIKASERSSPHGRQTRDTTKPLLALRLEHNLHPELLAILIKPRPIPALAPINFPCLQLKRAALVGLRRNNQVLEVLIRILHLLLERRHEPHPRHNPRRDLLVLQLEQQAHLPGQRVPDLRNLVTGASDLNRLLLDLHAHRTGERGGVLALSFALLARRAPREVGLVLAALRVGEVGAVILVDGQTEAALEAADVVLEKVGVFFEVDCFQRELPQTLAAVGVCCGAVGDTAATEFGACSVLEDVSIWFS